jgi:hypothetical protein
MDHCKICNELGGHKPDCPVRTFRTPEKSTRDYSGRELELDLFGSMDIGNPKYKAELARATTDPISGYVPFQPSMELVRKFQPAPATEPKKDFFRELRIAVQEKLGVDIGKDPDSVKAFTAVGSPLDKFHGTDAFISYTDKGRECLVTLDASLRPEKQAYGWKADLIIGDVPTPEDDEKGYLEVIAAYAGQIAEKIRQDMERDSRTGSVKRPPEQGRRSNI